MTNKEPLEQNVCCHVSLLYNQMKQIANVIFSLNITVMHVTKELIELTFYKL